MIADRPQYLNALIRKKNNGRVKVITGIRRSGKSYLLFELFKSRLLQSGVKTEHIIEIQLDGIGSAHLRNPIALNAHIRERVTDENAQYYIFIDEIQFCVEIPNPYVNGPEQKLTFVDTVLELMKDRRLDLYITGSNSKMLSKDVLTQFRDRGDEIHVMPLSFSEFWAACHESYETFSFPVTFPIKTAGIEGAWRDYCSYGGMPELLSLETDEEKSRVLKNLFDSTYLKDIIERNDIRNEKEILDILLDFTASAVGSLTNAQKLENRFKTEKKISVSHNTIERYLSFYCDAYLMRVARRYDIKGAAYFDTPNKYYFTDSGLRNARLNFRQIEESHIMENILFNDLIRRGYNVDIGIVPYNGKRQEPDGSIKRMRTQFEVDFVVNQGDLKIYIQSAYSVSDPEKRVQETNSLNRIKDSFPKVVITKDHEISRYDDNGIIYMGLWDFLLDENPFPF